MSQRSGLKFYVFTDGVVPSYQGSRWLKPKEVSIEFFMVHLDQWTIDRALDHVLERKSQALSPDDCGSS